MLPQIQTVLCTVPWLPRQVDQLRDAFAPAEFVYCDSKDDGTIRKTLERAQVAVLAGDLDDRVLDAPHIAWVHCDHAGLTHSAKKEVFDRRLVVTGSAGRSGPALAQHAFHFALAFQHDMRTALADQAAHRWGDAVAFRERGSLWGQKLGILGFGYTGVEMARIGRAFGMHVTVLRRAAGSSSPDVDVMLSGEEGGSVQDLLGSDVVMIAAGLSDATYRLFGAAEFKRMKRSAIIINMGRGPIIDEPALIDALKSGEIAAVGLDVFDVEPLPENSPLWDMPNVLVTPHATPQMPDKTQRSINVVLANLESYRKGGKMVNQIDERDIYTKV